MKILFINSVCGIRSTGRICTELAGKYEADGHEVKIAYGRESVPEKYQKYAVRIGTEWDNKISAIHTRVTDRHGFANKKATYKFLKWADEYDPDLLWLHNIHGYYINIELLFDWIKSRSLMQVKWTLHDCWAFTGHCSYFTVIQCECWKSHCQVCPQKKRYPSSYLCDNSFLNFERKKNAFTGVRNLTLITPSKWLANIVKESFLKEYPVEVVYNTIDTNVFKPTPSDFRKQFGLENKKIILGVASIWDQRKGLEDFLKLAERLDDDYVIILVGLSNKQMKNLPKRIKGIRRTNSAKELAAIYTASDIFLNLTYEDNFPTVNLEAKACGIPIITYDTGGSPESAGENSIVIPVGDINAVVNSINNLITYKKGFNK